VILQRPESHPIERMNFEISHGHLSRDDESRRPRQESNKNERAANQFQDGGQTHKRHEVLDFVASRRVAEQLLRAVRQEEEADGNAHDGQETRRNLGAKGIGIGHTSTNLRCEQEPVKLVAGGKPVR